LEDDFTQKMFLSALKRAIEKFKFTADKITFLKSGFTLQLTLKPGKGEKLPQIMQWLKSVFAKKWNRLHYMYGAFWADRYDSEVLYDDVITAEPIAHHISLLSEWYTRWIKGRITHLTYYFIKKLEISPEIPSFDSC
jgi:hypothetical protein